MGWGRKKIGVEPVPTKMDPQKYVFLRTAFAKIVKNQAIIPKGRRSITCTTDCGLAMM